MNKLKNLKKKIQRLEARQQKRAKKLAKLKRKLGAAETGAAGKTKTSKTQVKPAGTEEAPSVAKKVKRKLNLTPERRAQLAEAMRARWAAKRAVPATNTQDTAFDPGSASAPQ